MQRFILINQLPFVFVHFFNSPTKTTGMFSNVKHQVSGWLPSMPAMPAMPSMPHIPNIPGLKKSAGGEGAEGAVDALASENAEIDAATGLAAGAADDDEDRSRYIRYGPSA